MRVTWHPDAEHELIDAARFYNRRVTGLGADFLDAVDAAVEQIKPDPSRYPIVESDIHRCRVKRFPYSVYYRFVSGVIRVLVIKHHSREPDYWKPRQ